MEPSNESEVTGSENELPHPLKSCAVYYFGSLRTARHRTKDESVGDSTKVNIKSFFAECTTPTEPCLYRGTTQRSAAGTCCREAFRKLGALYAAGIHPKLYYVHHMWRGASVNTGCNLEYGSLLPNLSMPAL